MSGDGGGIGEQAHVVYGAKPTKTDVVVVVGGKEFQEHSRHLRYWSDYFERAFRSGMKEATTGRFEFHEQKADEWKMVRRLMTPATSTVKITMGNVEMIARWSNFLGLYYSLEECDKFMEDQISKGWAKPGDKIDYFALCMEHNLVQAKKAWYKFVSNEFLRQESTTLTLENVQTITEYLKEYKECQTEFWKFIKVFFPENTEMNDELLSNPLFTSCLHSGIYAKRPKKKTNSTKGSSMRRRNFDY